MIRKLLLPTFIVAVGMFAGCASRGGYTAYSAPPPPRVVGLVGRAPGPGYVWTDGYWTYRNRNWDWNQGSWLRPPRVRAVWVAPTWRQQGRNYRFYPGHWR